MCDACDSLGCHPTNYKRPQLTAERLNIIKDRTQNSQCRLQISTERAEYSLKQRRQECQLIHLIHGNSARRNCYVKS